jgi:hypothetical protein
VTSTWRTIYVALGALLLAVGFAASAQADVIDSATVSLSCNSYTLKVTGHALSHPNAAVQYQWGVTEGSLCCGMGGEFVNDTLAVKPKANQTFTASVTRSEPTPPFAQFQPDSIQPATLTTGATTWNTVPIIITNPFISCPSLNKCPRAQRYWIGRQRWPVTGLILGNLFFGTTFTYNDNQARVILNTPGGTDESVVLAHQLIAAKLNLFNGTPRVVHNPAFGSPDGAEYTFVLTNDADFLLGSGPLPQHVDPSSSLGQQMALDVALLNSYNTDAFTPPLADGTCHDALE